MQAREETKRREAVVEALNETSNIFALFDKTEWRPKADLTDYIVCDVSIDFPKFQLVRFYADRVWRWLTLTLPTMRNRTLHQCWQRSRPICSTNRRSGRQPIVPSALRWRNYTI